MVVSPARENPPRKAARVAIYDTPEIMGRRLSEALSRSGCEVIYDGPLEPQTARSDADVWVAKWTFLF
ncbi:MAG: hypothetical protein AB1324_04350, partial [Candidatus Micrarchaeota archaeon]